MCNTKQLALTKMDMLIASMDRLSVVMEKAFGPGIPACGTIKSGDGKMEVNLASGEIIISRKPDAPDAPDAPVPA